MQEKLQNGFCYQPNQLLTPLLLCSDYLSVFIPKNLDILLSSVISSHPQTDPKGKGNSYLPAWVRSNYWLPIVAQSKFNLYHVCENAT